jgi:hypothetical protein
MEATVSTGAAAHGCGRWRRRWTAMVHALTAHGPLGNGAPKRARAAVGESKRYRVRTGARKHGAGAGRRGDGAWAGLRPNRAGLRPPAMRSMLFAWPVVALPLLDQDRRERACPRVAQAAKRPRAAPLPQPRRTGHVGATEQRGDRRPRNDAEEQVAIPQDQRRLSSALSSRAVACSWRCCPAWWLPPPSIGARVRLTDQSDVE